MGLTRREPDAQPDAQCDAASSAAQIDDLLAGGCGALSQAEYDQRPRKAETCLSYHGPEQDPRPGAQLNQNRFCGSRRVDDGYTVTGIALAWLPVALR